jgi:glycosyltransferase involved in cell wall biosynthesis
MIIAAIPVRNQLRWTAPLVESLLQGDQVDQIWIYDNGSTDGTATWVHNRAIHDKRLVYVASANVRLYDMWNHMIFHASQIPSAKLAILNNDIRLPFDALKTMSETMEGYQVAFIDKQLGGFDKITNPTPAEAHWADRTGWAFMIDPSFWKGEQFAIHPDLIIWWGDDDLFRRAEERGARLCIVMGVGCTHCEWSSDSEYLGDKWADVEKDRETFARLWAWT